MDNLSTGNIKNLDNLNHPNCKIIEGDICNINFDDITSDINYIFHLASMVSVPLSVENPIECEETNVNATLRLLNSAVRNNVEKIIYSSSSSVYGQNKNMPLKETESLTPNSPYAASKASCEFYLQSFHENYGLNYVALRYFNVFGPKQDKNSHYAAVIPNFINSLLEGKQPVIYGDGEQTRDFVYVKDVVRANIAAAESDFNGVLNVASGKNITINRLYELVRTAVGMDMEPKYLPKRPRDIKHSIADISNLEKIDVQINSDDFENQIVETIEWFKTIH